MTHMEENNLENPDAWESRPNTSGTIILIDGPFANHKAEVAKWARDFHDNYLFFDYDKQRVEAYSRVDKDDVSYSWDEECSGLLSQDYHSMVASFNGRAVPTPMFAAETETESTTDGSGQTIDTGGGGAASPEGGATDPSPGL